MRNLVIFPMIFVNFKSKLLPYNQLTVPNSTVLIISFTVYCWSYSTIMTKDLEGSRCILKYLINSLLLSIHLSGGIRFINDSTLNGKNYY